MKILQYMKGNKERSRADLGLKAGPQMLSKLVSFLSVTFSLFLQTYFLCGSGWLNGTTPHMFCK